MEADPDNVVNLAAKPEHKARLDTMRKALREWQLSVHDAGLVPEYDWPARVKAGGKTIAELVRSPDYPLVSYLDAADHAVSGDAAAILTHLKSSDPVRAYWGVVGVLCSPRVPEADQELVKLMKHESGEVRAMAAWAYSRLGDAQRGRAEAVLNAMLKDHSPAAVTALNVIDWARLDPAKFRDGLAAAATSKGPTAEYESRMVEYRAKMRAKVMPK